MLATRAPPAIALIWPARRDSPRPAAMTRSASGPRPKTRLLPSGIPITRPAGVVTCAFVTALSTAISRPPWPAFSSRPGYFIIRPGLPPSVSLTGGLRPSAASNRVAGILGRRRPPGIPELGDGQAGLIHDLLVPT